MQSRFITSICIAGWLLLSVGCVSYDFAHRKIQQGNLLTQAKIARLKLGMSKQEVTILMGSSLLTPIFAQNRWDYAYSMRMGNKAIKVRKVSLYFADGILTRIKS